MVHGLSGTALSCALLLVFSVLKCHISVSQSPKYGRLKRITNQFSFVYTVVKSLYILKQTEHTRYVHLGTLQKLEADKRVYCYKSKSRLRVYSILNEYGIWADLHLGIHNWFLLASWHVAMSTLSLYNTLASILLLDMWQLIFTITWSLPQIKTTPILISFLCWHF